MSQRPRSQRKTTKPSDLIFADAALAARLEAATVAILTAYEKISRKGKNRNGTVALEDICGGKMLFAGPGSPINHAIGMGLGQTVTLSDMDRVEKFFRSRNTPVEIMVSPLVDIAFPQMLVNRGYRPTEFENVLVLSLHKWKPQPIRTKKNGPVLKIRKNTPDQAALATKVISDGFSQMGMPPEVRATLEGFQRLPNALCYMAFVDGVPVASAAGMISPKHKVALLFGTSTLPKYRKMGAQTLLLQARLKEAAAAGCELATVSTQPGTTSQHNAERAGFRVAYTKTTYVLD